MITGPFILHLSASDLILLKCFPTGSNQAPAPLRLLDGSSKPIGILILPALTRSATLNLLLLLMMYEPILSIDTNGLVRISLNDMVCGI